jgi:hypothetical protein
MNTPPGGWLGSMMQAGPSLPLNGEEGDILQRRNGQWVSVRPQEGLRITHAPVKDGDRLSAAIFDSYAVEPNTTTRLDVEQQIIESVRRIGPEDLPCRVSVVLESLKPPHPGTKPSPVTIERLPPGRRTAWEKLLEDNED